MKLYNTLSKKVETLSPISGKTVKIYVCGPTVYAAPQLGNFRTYINTDFLRRTLKYLGYKVDEVMNITDIEDKIIRDSAKLGVEYTELTKKYEKIFLENLKELNIEMPEHMPRATAEIPEMIKIIEKLLADGYAYKSDDGSVYFDISKFKDYGRLSNVKNRELKACDRTRADEYDKENVQDFALWKAEKPGEPSWDAPFGKGRPGWHIECTAMSTKYLRETIDIHAGGVDLIFPHHENEIAQSEAYTGKKFVNEWFHAEHLLIDGKRMGKSEGNAYVLEDLEKRFKVEPLAFRLLCLQSHYRDKLNFTGKSITDAQNTLDGLRSFVGRLMGVQSTDERYPGRLENIIQTCDNTFHMYLSNDLSVPGAFASVFKLVKEINKFSNLNVREANLVLDALENFDEVLGLRLLEFKVDKIPESVHELAIARETAREVKDYKKSDELRAKIEKAGFEVEDTQDGSVLRKK